MVAEVFLAVIAPRITPYPLRGIGAIRLVASPSNIGTNTMSCERNFMRPDAFWASYKSARLAYRWAQIQTGIKVGYGMTCAAFFGWMLVYFSRERPFTITPDEPRHVIYFKDDHPALGGSPPLTPEELAVIESHGLFPAQVLRVHERISPGVYRSMHKSEGAHYGNK